MNSSPIEYNFSISSRISSVEHVPQLLPGCFTEGLIAALNLWPSLFSDVLNVNFKSALIEQLCSQLVLFTTPVTITALELALGTTV